MASKQNVSIFWFRQDLRVHDNPGLTSALSLGNVLPIYILDDINSNQHRMGAASRWWLHNSLKNLRLKMSFGIDAMSRGELKEIRKLKVILIKKI